MVAFRRYYPGFFGAAFLVLLRLAIGWHLLTEGVWKIMSTPEGQSSILGRYLPPTEGKPFSSEGYNRNAAGPFEANFRSIVPDVDGREALDPARLKAEWKARLGRVADHYGFDDAQKGQAAATLSRQEAVADAWFDESDTREKVRKYLDNVDELARLGAKRGKMSYEVERYNEARRGLDADRRSLLAPVETWSKGLRDAWSGLATETQVQDRGPYKEPLSQVEQADWATMIGLSACGLALMLGLFTPVAALGASTFLMLFYLSMPPFPGLPVPPNAEGHYLFVNKNLIEFLACLALAATPSGLWLGIDALLFGWIDRVRTRRAIRREREDFDLAVREAAGLPYREVAAATRPTKTTPGNRSDR